MFIGPLQATKNLFTRNTKMRCTKLLCLAAILLMAAGTALADQIDTITFSGAKWSDGGSLNGTFTVDTTTWTLLSADVVTGNGTSDGFVGQSYIYNVAGQANTVLTSYFDAVQGNRVPANEVVLTLGSDNHSYYTTFLDWQNGSSSLYIGSQYGQYSSENSPDYGIVRSLNSDGGSSGTPVSATPEPSSLLLFGTGLIGCLGALRRKFAR
jgi:hypothetical protein